MIVVNRYKRSHSATSHLDPLTDLTLQLEFLTASDYVVEVLVKQHNVGAADARARAKPIAAHIKTALSYIAQADAGPTSVAFLPCYYAILNLLKVYILFSPQHNELRANRWHGATYDGYAKSSQSLLTEEITLRSSGAIPLAYRILSGKAFPDRTTVRMGDVYSFIYDVGAEWEVATGAEAALAALEFNVTEDARGKSLSAQVFVPGEMKLPALRALAALRGMRTLKGSSNQFVSKKRYPSAVQDELIVDSHVNRTLLYFAVDRIHPWTPISTKALVMPEEFPIILAFFHMSSVVRYKPEFLMRLQASRYWPVLASARRHALFKFLQLFWSHVQQEYFSIERV